MEEHYKIIKGIRALTLPLAIAGTASLLSYVSGQDGTTVAQKVAHLAQQDPHTLYNHMALATVATLGGGACAVLAGRRLEERLTSSWYDPLAEAEETGRQHAQELENSPVGMQIMAGTLNGMIRSIATTLKPAVNYFSKDKFMTKKITTQLDVESAGLKPEYITGQVVGYAMQAALLLDLTVGKLI
jgi:hypothetical protein